MSQADNPADPVGKRAPDKNTSPQPERPSMSGALPLSVLVLILGMIVVGAVFYA